MVLESIYPKRFKASTESRISSPTSSEIFRGSVSHDATYPKTRNKSSVVVDSVEPQIVARLVKGGDYRLGRG